MAQSRSGRFDVESISNREWLAVVLALLTGLIHVYAGVIEGRAPVALAGVGFFGAIVLYLANYRRRLLALVGVFYTSIQLPLWYVVKAGQYTPLGYVDKAIQVILVVSLASLYWTSRGGTAGRNEASAGGTGGGR